MPIIPFRVGQINSFMPSIDARNSDQTFVLAGRNFLFDSKGPKSGFATKQLTPFPFGAPNDVQGKRVEGRTFVFTQDAILNWRSIAPITWDLLYTFSSAISDTLRAPWQVIYLDSAFFFAQQSRGFFRADILENTDRLWVKRKTDADILGLIPNILGMDVVRGRAILVNATTIQWSALQSLTNLTPVLAGAGIQTISAFVKGTFLALTSFQDGFVVWTTGGAVLAEYIGGDEVWRFSAYQSQERPYSAWSTVSLINGGSVYLSRRGLKITNATEAPKDWTPDFNEFLRDYLDDRIDNQRKWRLEYDTSTETIYLSESSNLNTYWQTFVLKPTLNKWGIFSDSTYGFLPLSEEYFGYVDSIGVPQYFNPTGLFRETDPDNALGLSRVYPRFEKQHNVLSSSVVSRAVVYDATVPTNNYSVAQAGWYPAQSMDSLQGNGRKGLDSWVEIGYLRPPELHRVPDAMMELQEISIGSIPSGAPAVADFTTDWNLERFYADVEDMNSAPTITSGDSTDDWDSDPAETVDLLTAAAVDMEDYMYLDFPTATFADESTEDLMTESGTEDLFGFTLGLPEVTYDIIAKSSEDGITFDEYVPELARFDTGARTWVVLSSGNFHRLRLEATDPLQYYHVKYLECTVQYSGQIV